MKVFYKVTLLSSIVAYPILGQAVEKNLIHSDYTKQNLSIGDQAATTGGTYSTAIGEGSTATGSSALSLGTQSHAKGNNSVVIGALSNVSNNSTVGIGAAVKVKGDGATAVGSKSESDGDSSIAVGYQAKSEGDSSIAIGSQSESVKQNTIALGSEAKANQDNSIAIGGNTKTNVADGIAIGYQSMVTRGSGSYGFNPYPEDKDKSSSKAFYSTGAAVSIGKEGKIRQITHVSAGTEDTDAVNVAQLKSVIHLGLKFKGDHGGPVTNKLGSQVDIKGDNKNITTELKQTPTGTTIIKVELNKDLDVNSLKAKDHIQVGNVKVDNQGITIANGQMHGPSLTKNGLDNANNKITHVASGFDGKSFSDIEKISNSDNEIFKNAVNVGDLTQAIKSVKTAINHVDLTKGLDFSGNTGHGQQKLGSHIAIQGSKADPNAVYSSENLTTQYTQQQNGNGVIEIKMKDTPTFKAINVGRDKTGAQTKITQQGITIQSHKGQPAVSLTAQGLNNGGNVISNVADGQAPMDAVNLRQLDGLKKEMHHIQAGIDDKIHKVSKESRAGSASAVATALLPQPFSAGRSMVGASLGHYRDQQAIAIGVSRISDNGKWIVKTAVSKDTQKNFGGGMSFGYQW
ncbi:hypothetical protein A6A19_00215 [Actinobacillus delphinicola]|uniref:YadA-like family protein n=1 Tax=Actinobacillus delphinicola TaxID=51161 RepID=UPI0024415FEB|nr:YadA-like family protein [Actinobacillus delphinicola]MDG6896469.1 hypothetical protein [Actinobacillus delphinicola]